MRSITKAITPSGLFYGHLAASVVAFALIAFSTLGSDGPGCAPAKRVGTNTCLACHDGRTASDKTEFLAGLHGAFDCEDCHGPGSLHVQNVGRGSGFIDNPRRLPYPAKNALCAECHAQEAAGFATTAHASRELACFECHDVHREGAMGVSTPNNTLLTHEGYRETCSECHERQVEAYGFSAHALFPEVTCGACHNVHVTTMFTAEPANNMLCLRCHQSRALGFTSDAAVDAHTGDFHPVDPAGSGASRCVSCHLPPVNSAQPERTHDHTLGAVSPVTINGAILANAEIIPASSCSGVTGCHDGTAGHGELHDLFDVNQNTALQTLFESIGDVPTKTRD